MSSTGRERTTSQVLRTALADSRAVDWDATVRRAFLEGCLQQGVRGQLAVQALGAAHDPRAERGLKEAAEDAARRAALAWLTIETCLERYGELAALALERCIEEASLQIRRRSSSPSAAGSIALVDRDDCARSIVERGRERLARFWGSSDTTAA
jgi:hypothetical protein